MKIFKGTITNTIRRTPNVISIQIKLSEDIIFIAGQFLQIIFDEENKMNKDLNKYLSFSSAPGRDYIEFTKRLTDSFFSQRIENLKCGDTLTIKAPFGNCILDEKKHKKLLCLIGGIGITPVISIYEDISVKKLDIDSKLLYANRNEQEIAFKNEFDELSKTNPKLKTYYIVSDCDSSDTECIPGHINEELIYNKVPDFKERIVFIFGPPKMVAAMKELCLKIGCENSQVKSENFAGY